MKYLILSSCLLVPLLAGGQILLDRQVVGASGNFSSAVDLTLSATTGDLVVTTAIQGSIVLTQGFQQPDTSVYVVDTKEKSVEIHYRIWPNPAGDEIHFSFTSEEVLPLRIRLYASDGRLIEDRYFQTGSDDVLTFYTAHWATATYFLNVVEPKRQRQITLPFQVVH